jgi:hypothetical protein
VRDLNKASNCTLYVPLTKVRRFFLDLTFEDDQGIGALFAIALKETPESRSKRESEKIFQEKGSRDLERIARELEEARLVEISKEAVQLYQRREKEKMVPEDLPTLVRADFPKILKDAFLAAKIVMGCTGYY